MLLCVTFFFSRLATIRELVHQVTITFFFNVFCSTAESLTAHFNPLKRREKCFVPTKLGKREHDQDNQVFFFFLLDNHREPKGREGKVAHTL